MTARGESKVVSSFTINPTMRVVTEDGELILGEAHTDKGTTGPSLRLPLTSFHSKRDLIRQLPSADLQWTGSANNVQGLLRVLARRPVPRRPGSNMLGDYNKGEHHVWLGPDCAISKDGFLSPSPCVFRPDLGAGSGLTWAAVPTGPGRSFRSTWARIPEHLGTDSGAPGHPG